MLSRRRAVRRGCGTRVEVFCPLRIQRAALFTSAALRPAATEFRVSRPSWRQEGPRAFQILGPSAPRGPPRLLKRLPLFEEAVVVPGAIEIHVVGEANQRRELPGSSA